jgi:hypothetical protein
LNTLEAGRCTKISDVLTDDVLLEIFDCYRREDDTLWEWRRPLVHVCRRWRQIIFQSPHRLNLKILCTSKTPVRKNLGIWPVFPIAIDFRCTWSDPVRGDIDNIIAALERPDRVGYLKLDITNTNPVVFATVTSKPFPLPTHLIIHLYDGHGGRSFPDEFLGGSAPRLQIIRLRNIAIPTLPNILLSASDLVELHLRRIPPTGYISPVAMAMCLATSPRLNTLTIEFSAVVFGAFVKDPPFDSTAVLPALTNF